MVFCDFDDFEEQYGAIRQQACGPAACAVMILVALEVDALSTATMLCQLLRADSIAHTVRPVHNFAHLLSTYNDHVTSDIRTVFMINCGAIHDLPKHLNLEMGGDVRCFVMDHHRPIHLKNYYSKHSVVVFGSGLDDEDVPSDGSELSYNGGDSSTEGSVSANDSNSEEENDEVIDQEQEQDSADEEHEHELDDEEEDVEAGADVEGEDVEGEGASGDGGEGGGDTGAKGAVVAEEEADLENAEDAEESTDERDDDAAGDAENDFDGHSLEPDEPSLHGDLSAVAGDDDNADDEDVVVGRRRKGPSESQLRKVKRQKVLKYYRRVPGHAPPTAIVVMPFVKSQFSGNGQEPVDLIWQSILGLTDHYLKGNVAEQYYAACCHLLKIELGEHLSLSNSLTVSVNPDGAGGEAVSVGGSATGQITESLDYRFFLYRHWSLYESMCHSSCIAAKFPVWKSEGLKRLQIFLAEIGVSLQQCSQGFQFMDPQCRQLFEAEIVRNSSLRTKYNLGVDEITFKSFCRHIDYKNPVAAADVVIAATGLLEHAPAHSEPSGSGPGDQVTQVPNEHFFRAWKLLGDFSSKTFVPAAEAALGIQRALVRQASALLDGQDLIHRYHRIYYAYIKAVASADRKDFAHSEDVFSKSNVLLRLGQFIMHVKRELPKKSGGWKGSNLLPLILLSEVYDGVLIVGVSPLLQAAGQDADPHELEAMDRLLPLTNFPQFFQLAARDLRVTVRFDTFDPNCVTVAKDDAQDFLGALDNAMKKATPRLNGKPGKPGKP